MSPRDAGPLKKSKRRTARIADGRPSFFGDVGVAPVSTIPVTLRLNGIDPEPLIEQAGLDPRLFDVPTSRAPLSALTRLLELCVEATGTRHFALLIGQQFEMPMLGPLGYMMMNEATVHAALRRLVLDMTLQDRAAVATIENLSDHLAGLSYAVCTPRTPAVWLADDVSAMIGWRILRSLCGSNWRPVEVRLAHARPADLRPYREFFAAPVRFDVPLSMLVFEKRWLDLPVAGADPQLLDVLDRLANSARGAPQRVTDRVRRALRGAVLSGRADARAIAELFSISERTLRRRLADEGSSFQALVAEARLTVAEQLLAATQLPVREIAAALHYSDITAFSRAFRGWTGKPPSASRRLT